MSKVCFVIFLLGALLACENTSQIENTSKKLVDTVTTVVNTKASSTPVNVNNAVVSFKTFPKGENDVGIPQATLYLYTSLTTDSLFLANDVGGVTIAKNNYTYFDIPEHAILAIESYYAGAGNYYYVETKENVLIIYKGEILEPSPEAETPDVTAQYKPFKRFIFYQDKVVEENL